VDPFTFTHQITYDSDQSTSGSDSSNVDAAYRMRWENVTELDLSENDIASWQTNDFNDLLNPNHFPQLEQLNLSHNHLGQMSINDFNALLQASIRFNRIFNLDLSYNDLSNQQVQQLCAILSNAGNWRNMTELHVNLIGNSISYENRQRLAKINRLHRAIKTAYLNPKCTQDIRLNPDVISIIRRYVPQHQAIINPTQNTDITQRLLLNHLSENFAGAGLNQRNDRLSNQSNSNNENNRNSLSLFAQPNHRQRDTSSNEDDTTVMTRRRGQ
jgi:hypothetical protein